ncbi:MAG: hypothetical protein VYD34_00635 [Verrucomicrobiota bacterium]|nr:hypothetical protein [Verrucomicrobiota bacterium]
MRKTSIEVARIEADMGQLNSKILDQLPTPLSKKHLEDIRR